MSAEDVELGPDGLQGHAFAVLFQKIPHMMQFFKGVYSINDIPRHLKVREFVVVNLSKKSEKGTHWFCIVRSHFKLYEVFNSLGFSNLDVLLPYVRVGANADFVFNQRAYQLHNTNTCGFYVIHFLIHRVLNFDLSFHHLLAEIYVTNNEENENIVTTFCQKLIKSNNDDALFD